MAFAALVAAPQRLAIDRHHPVGRLILAALANAFMKRWKDRSKACGSSMRNTRLKVSWLGRPCFSVNIGSSR